MTQFTLHAAAGLALAGLGFYHLLVRPHLLRKLLALNVMSSGIFLLLVTIASRGEAGDPDPVPHAMVLTGIVIAVSITAFSVGIVRRMHAAAAADIPDEEELR